MIITLIGYRGCGKSSVGPLLAERIGCSFADSDQLIESQAGKSIEQIFADDGEAEFRRLETETLEDLLDTPPAVVATGGGAVLADINRRRMKDAGPVVWLQAPAAQLAARIASDDVTGKNSRPSLTGKSIEDEVSEVLQARIPLYRDAATFTVDIKSATPEQLAEQIFDAVTAVDIEDAS